MVGREIRRRVDRRIGWRECGDQSGPPERELPLQSGESAGDHRFPKKFHERCRESDCKSCRSTQALASGKYSDDLRAPIRFAERRGHRGDRRRRTGGSYKVAFQHRSGQSMGRRRSLHLLPGTDAINPDAVGNCDEPEQRRRFRCDFAPGEIRTWRPKRRRNPVSLLDSRGGFRPFRVLDHESQHTIRNGEYLFAKPAAE